LKNINNLLFGSCFSIFFTNFRSKEDIQDPDVVLHPSSPAQQESSWEIFSSVDKSVHKHTVHNMWILRIGGFNFMLVRNSTVNVKKVAKNRFLLFAKCVKMLRFLRICIQMLQLARSAFVTIKL
jgi:hypothetical protein